jgi:hypothetical protein
MVASFPGRATRSAGVQAGFQLALLATALGLGIVCGMVGGALLRLPVFEPKTESFYEDAGEWNVPEEAEEAPELLALAAAAATAAVTSAAAAASDDADATPSAGKQPAAGASALPSTGSAFGHDSGGGAAGGSRPSTPDSGRRPHRNSPRWQPAMPRVPTLEALETAGRPGQAGAGALRPSHSSPRWAPTPPGMGGSVESGLDLHAAAAGALGVLRGGGGSRQGATPGPGPAGGGSAASERGALLAAAACDVADWQARVHGPLLARLRAYASAEGYADGFGGLLRFARNASEHPPAGAELTPLLAALQEAGFTDPAPRRPRSVAARRSLLADYILCLFPALSIAVYECGGGAPSVK